MEPFLITCPGCKIRLQITNPDFIGREFACPRCKCRLEVQEPSAEERAAQGESEPDHVTGTFRLGPPKHQSQDATTAVGDFADIESVLAGSSSRSSEKWIGQPATEPAVPVAPVDITAAEQQAAQRRWTWLVFSIVSGTLAALMVTSGVIYFLSVQREREHEREVAQLPDEENKKPTPPKEDPDKPADAPPEDIANAPEKPEEPETPEVTLPSEIAEAGDSNKPTTPVVEAPTTEPPTDPAAPPGFESSKPSTAEESPNPSVTEAILSGANDGSLLTPREGTSLRSAQGGLLDLPYPDPTILKPKPLLVDVNRQLSEVVADLRAEKVRLVDFLDLFSQLSGVPVSLDPVVLTRAGIDPFVEVTVIAEGQSLRQIGETAVRPLGLAMEELGGGVVVTFPFKGSPPPLDLSGIPYNANQVAEFEQFIQRSVDPVRWGEPPNGAQISLAGGEVRFQGPPRVAWGVKKLLDDMRGALTAPSPLLSNEELLSTPIEFKDGRPLRLEDLTARLETIAGCEIRIDWVSLGAVGWSQETTVSITAQAEPLQSVLQRICEPRGWGFRLLTKNVVEITTFLELYAGAETRVVSLRKKADAGGDLEQIRNELAKAIAPQVPRGADPLSLVQVLREPPMVSIRGPAAVQSLAEAWLAQPDSGKPTESAPASATAGS